MSMGKICSPVNFQSNISEIMSTPSEILQVQSPKNQLIINHTEYFSPQDSLQDSDLKSEIETHIDEVIIYQGKTLKSAYVQTSPPPSRDEQNNISFSQEKKKEKSNRGRKKKDFPYINPVQAIGENLLQAYGSLFVVKRINKKNDENTIVRCEICERDFRKKSIRSHTVSLLHIAKLG